MTTYKTETTIRKYEDDRLVSETKTITTESDPQDRPRHPIGFGKPLTSTNEENKKS